MTTSTAIATISKGQLPIQNITDIQQVGKMLAASGMFGVTNDLAGATMVMTCIQEGISFLDFKRTYHLINGVPSKRADSMLAEFVARGGKYTIKEATSKRAAAIFSKGENSLDMEVTYEQALAAEWPLNGKGGVKDNWRKTPDAMLWARLVSKAVRLLDPGVNAGIYTPEETDDFTAPAERVEKVVSADVANAIIGKSATSTPIVPTAPAAPVVDAEIVPTPAAAEPAEKPHPVFNAGALARAVNSCPAKSKDPEFTADDPNVCPVAPKGNHHLLGKPWSGMLTSFLESALKAVELKVYSELTEAHAEAIRAELAKRKEFANA